MNTKANFEGSAYDSKFFTMRADLESFERVIYHCPDCFNLPLVEINPDLINISSKCDKNHVYEKIPLNDFYQKLIDTSINSDSNNLIKNVICFKCKKICDKGKDTKEDLSKILEGFGYCNGCDKIICSSCVKIHENEEKKKDPLNHKLVPLDKYINFCPFHRNKYSAYCFDCKKNTCVKCTEHKQHKKYHFDDYLLFDEDAKKYKKNIINLRTNCENMENKLNTLLDKIRNDFHLIMQKHINILILNELFLDAYQTNQFNYFYLQNILKNFSHLETIQKELNDKDIKTQLIDMIQKINIDELFKEDLNNIKIEPNKNEELLKITQTQNVKQMKNIDYNKDTVNPTFKIESNQSMNKKNNNNVLEMTDSKMESILMKNTEKNKNKEENEINNNNINTNTNKSKKSFKESININNVNQSYNNDIKREEINLNDISIKSLRLGNIKFSCEFIGKNYSTFNYKLKELPNNIETNIEIKNNSNVPLPKGCYLFDENNCASLMLLDNVINCLEPGKSYTKKLKFDIYIYSKGNYNVKLSMKDPSGSFISSNKFEFCLIIE